jgi:hypothetical protein
MLEIKTVTNGPITKYLQRVCHGTLLSLISFSLDDALPSGRLWYDGPNAAAHAIGYAIHRSRSHDAVIRVYDDTGNVIETHEHGGDFKDR